MGEEAVGRGALPSRVAGREVVADVALADGAEQGVGQGVQAGVGVRMADEPGVVRNLHPA